MHAQAWTVFLVTITCADDKPSCLNGCYQLAYWVNTLPSLENLMATVLAQTPAGTTRWTTTRPNASVGTPTPCCACASNNDGGIVSLNDELSQLRVEGVVANQSFAHWIIAVRDTPGRLDLTSHARNELRMIRCHWVATGHRSTKLKPCI